MRKTTISSTLRSQEHGNTAQLSPQVRGLVLTSLLAVCSNFATGLLSSQLLFAAFFCLIALLFLPSLSLPRMAGVDLPDPTD